MNALLQKSTLELHGLLKQKEISSVELTEAFLTRISECEPKTNAFITVTREQAIKQAKAADQLFSSSASSVTSLTGIPIALKDVILVKDVRATAGSKFLKNFVSIYDSTVTSKLRKSGAVFLGKTNCDEFAMGSSNENSAYGTVKNPWNLSCVPGGSSGGSAAAVAAAEAPLSLGTDTGGSIRQPAALCGIVGLKPTYGRVSRYGIVAFASSLDQVGPFAKRVEDSAVLFEAISGPDPNDSTSANVAQASVLPSLKKSIKGLKIGVPKEYLPAGLNSEVKENFSGGLKVLEKLGAIISEISLPHTEYAIACYYIVATAEASSNLARYDGIRYTTREDATDLRSIYLKSRTEGFGAEVRRRIMLGTFVLSSGYYDAYYKKAEKVRSLLRRDFDQAFEKVDVIATPTSPTPAFPLGSKTDNPLEMYLSDIFTVSIPLAGLPGISVPSGFSKNQLPLGLQLIGKPFDEATLFQTSYAFEQETRYFEKVPPL